MLAVEDGAFVGVVYRRQARIGYLKAFSGASSDIAGDKATDA